MVDRFGTQARSFEELVAKLGSAKICGALELEAKGYGEFMEAAE